MNAAELLLEGEAASRRGRQAALVCEGEATSFAQLAEQVRRAAAALVGLGVRPGERVLLLMRDTPEFAAAWLGVVRMGGVAVALNNKLSEAEYRHILADSGARLAIVEDVFATARADLTAELQRDGRIVVAGGRALSLPDWREAPSAAFPAGAFAASGDSPAFMLYSSGTTGKPKGLVHAHGSLLRAGAAFRCFGLGEGDRVFATSKFFFAYGLEHGLLAPLALGATSILSADWPTAESVAELVSRHQPAALFSVPTMYRRLLEAPERLTAFRAIRRFVSAGEHLSAQLVEHWRSATGGELLNLYGMSETFCACMVTPPGTSNGRRTGAPLEDVEMKLVTPEGPDSPPGAGELWIRHPTQARGYTNLPEQTAAHFREGWFQTGDLFERDAEGFYVYQGRADDLVKIAGQWVRPADLEAVVASLPQVAEVACVAVQDADGLDRLALFVAPRASAPEALQAAAAACEANLPRHKRPKWLRTVEQLPRTATGKVQRFKLRELLRDEAPGKR